MTACNKIFNEYAKMIHAYDKKPKAVIAGVAVALLMRLGETEDQDEINKIFADEWRTLHINGIIPQKPK